MRTRYNKDANDIVANFDRYIEEKEKLQDFFSNNKDKKIYVEIGMGKGDFIISKALNNPDINFIGLEKNTFLIICHFWSTFRKKCKSSEVPKGTF